MYFKSSRRKQSTTYKNTWISRVSSVFKESLVSSSQIFRTCCKIKIDWLETFLTRFIVYLKQGLLNAIEAPHHFKINDEWEYREGVVTDLPNKEDHGSWIDIGLMNVSCTTKQ